MNLHMVGIDCHRADLARREPVSFVRGQVEGLLPVIKAYPGVEGCVLLATCNRTELYLHTADGAPDPLAVLAGAAHFAAADYEAYSVRRNGEDAMHHLFEVAAGLQSQILGDSQIITQVRGALDLAREQRTTDAVLDSLFRRAVTAGKRVRTETCFVPVSASAADSGVRRAAAFFGGLNGRRAVVIGNGEMGRLAASLLHEAGCAVTVTLRSYRHGVTVIPPGCTTHPYDDRFAILEGADLCFSATTSPHYTITAEQLRGLQNPPRLLVDLAMPRDIEAPPSGEGESTVWNLDDLGGAGEENLPELEHARAILREEENEFLAWLSYRAALPVIAALKDAALDRVHHDHGYAALDEAADAPGMAALAVHKTIDLLLGAMKEQLDAEQLEHCLNKIRKGTRT